MSFLSKTLKRSDIENKFSVPKKWVDEYWPNIGNNYRATIMVWHQPLACSGEWHEFVLSTRSEGPLKPEFMRKGWKEFVKKNSLRVGDVVHFGKRAGQAADYTIMIERKFAL